MFCIENKDVERILRDYGFRVAVKGFYELQRYNYEQMGPYANEVRLIIRVDFENAPSLVVRFKNEKDVTERLLESQCEFAQVLFDNGIPTPIQYKANGKFVNWYELGAYRVLVTVEQFVENEITLVDQEVAKKAGILLAKTHTISEENGMHIRNAVLFNPFAHNDLFAYDSFLSLENNLDNEGKMIFDKIVEKYDEYMNILAPLNNRPRYAVQGDFSDCNLYTAVSEEIGVFDFNRSGDNVLFCDAVMQAVFVSRLMTYPEGINDDYQYVILNAFLEGYQLRRLFTNEERTWLPYLCCIIDAFWSADICWNTNSLLSVHKLGDTQSVHQWLVVIEERLKNLEKFE